MKKLAVYYCGWGEDWLLGNLADDGTQLLFEYSHEAIRQGIAFSPLNLPLREQAHGDFPSFLCRLPGFIADSLPDGWGLMLMDRIFRRNGVNPGPLDRLAFMGNRAMGALRYEPSEKFNEHEPDWDLLRLTKESERVLAGDIHAALLELALTGGSPQGARPKALVRYDKTTGKISTRSEAPGEPWLIKFPAQGEHKEVCAIEQLYAELARDCGIDMPDSACFDLSARQAAFGVARFDRKQGMRVQTMSLAGLLHADFRIPGAVHYGQFLRATRYLTAHEGETIKAYARAVFNVVFHNRDDHPKNVAWCLGKDRRWYLAPAFDLTFNAGPGGQHHMDIGGKGEDIKHEDLLKLAEYAGISSVLAGKIIDQTCAVSEGFIQKAAGFPIRKATVQSIGKSIERCRHLLG